MNFGEQTCFEITTITTTISIQFAEVTCIHMSACAGEYTQNRINTKSLGVQIVRFRPERRRVLERVQMKYPWAMEAMIRTAHPKSICTWLNEKTCLKQELIGQLTKLIHPSVVSSVQKSSHEQLHLATSRIRCE